MPHPMDRDSMTSRTEPALKDGGFIAMGLRSMGRLERPKAHLPHSNGLLLFHAPVTAGWWCAHSS